MNVREVTEYITNSFLKISPYKVSGTSLPCIINLLNKTKKEKAQAVENAFFDYLKGKDSIIILSVSTSSRLFQFILGNVPKIWFINGKVVDQNKRKDVVALIFSHQPVSI